ncbi:MAG: TraM recognition domain-containing protein, partial [Ruminiclostridium sp.]|nr:TraM recognition domain-containing protein [Ruminiclostridium sp.]
WVGKKAAIAEANRPIRKTLRPCPEESVNWDTTENLYIEGDNLEVLKLLQESYLGKVKMIYIDPPYNTGHDFIYPDSFIMDNEDYNEGTGYFDEEGNVNYKRENSASAGRYHSDWCSMIYSRLMLARNLLADDGVIFISIDYNEQENMKKICDEVLGEENCLGIVANINNPKGRSDDKYIATSHEYVIIYAKNEISVKWYGFEPTDDKIIKRYNKTDNNGKKYREIDLRKTGENDLREDRPNLFYYFYYNPDTSDFYPSRDDRSMDSIANIFFSQIIQALIEEADNNINSRLDIPVRFILDDFGAITEVKNFDQISSIIRSREISVSIILQSITQLDAIYGSNRARTIINNCDHIIYLGGHDYKTASYISDLANVPLENIINMPTNKQYILTRGQKPIYADRLAPDEMVYEDEKDEDNETGETDVTDEPEKPDMSVFRSTPKSIKDTAETTNIVINNIPRSIVSTYGPANRRICKLSFAYKKEGDKVIYALLRLPAYRVKLEKGTYSFDLGKSDTDYICDISDTQDKVSLTAKDINLIYRRSRVWYITYIKNRSSAITAPKS